MASVSHYPSSEVSPLPLSSPPLKMKVLAALLCLAVATSARMAYKFSDGYLDILGAEPVQNFDCKDRSYGYYADVAASCQVFHVCLPVVDEAGQLLETAHFSFFCGNETIFDQESLTCAHPDYALPCSEAETFYQISNADFGRIPEEGFVPEVNVLARSNIGVNVAEETRSASVTPVETPVAEASVSETAEAALDIPASVPETAEVELNIPASVPETAEVELNIPASVPETVEAAVDAPAAAPEVAEASVVVPDNVALYSADEDVTDVTSSDEPGEVTEDNTVL
ncbi:uncharacterized protein LOC135090092 [Scylla paramamosain]|uniref:uncharacterized protein LOC135090092 n=1 Tax=Scylla paramamosain TaxID=85552 RepID=UPI003083D684